MFDDMTLGDLFAEADAIGNQYQTDEEREDHLDELLDAISGVEGFEQEEARIRAELQQLRSC